METKNKKMTTHAECAKMIRKELKNSFPEIKFSVRSSAFSMCTSVDIEWTDGPASCQVDEVVKKYQYGHFDGMNDTYEYSNLRDDLTQVKYVMTQRTLSEKAVKEFAEKFKQEYGINESTEDIHRSFEWCGSYTSWNRIAWKELDNKDLRYSSNEVLDDPRLEEKKNDALKIANNFQEKADKWYALAKRYNDEIIEKWFENWREKKNE
jgi:hypothetical protein